MAVPSNISLFNYRIHNDLNCDFCLHLCLHEELLDSVPKSVYSPSFFIFANLLIFNKIILILKKVIIYHFTIANSKLCFYTQTPPSYPLQLPLTQGESWYFFSKMVSNSTLPLFVEGVLERGREFMDYKLVYKFPKKL